MRPLTAQEIQCTVTGVYSIHGRVSIYDGSAWIDVSAFVREVGVTEDIDNPLATANITLFRNTYSQNIAPLVDGPFNRKQNPANAFAAIVYPARRIKAERAITPQGDAPAAGDWQSMFDGFIDSVEWGGENCTLSCTDQGARLRDTFIEVERVHAVYSGDGARVFMPSQSYVAGEIIFPANRNGKVYVVTTGGTAGATEPTWPASGNVTSGSVVFTFTAAEATSAAAENVLQSLLTANLGAGVVTLYTPVSPAWQVKPYKQQRESVLDALRAVTMQLGWDCRYKWDAGSSTYRLTLYQPDRAKTTPDATFAAMGSASPTTVPYLDVKSLSVGIEDIRNVCRVVYSDTNDRDAAGNPTRKFNILAVDAASIATFGRRYAEVAESSASLIDTSTEAQRLADAMVSDLSQPKATQEVEVLFYPWAEVGDLYRFKANGIHYTSDQDLAVVSIKHTLALGGASTTFQVRGKPAGAVQGWHEILVGAGSSNESQEVSQPFMGTVTLTASPIVGGVVLMISAAQAKDNTWESYEYHVSNTAGFTPTGATMVAVGKMTSVEYAKLIPGGTYYAKIVPLARHELTVVRGLPSPEVSFVAGYVPVNALQPTTDYEWLPRNGEFGTRSDMAALPDGWREQYAGNLGTYYYVMEDGSGSFAGARHIKFVKTADLSGGEIRSERFFVHKNNPFRISMAVKVPGGSANGTMTLVWLRADGSQISAPNWGFVPTASNVWQEFAYVGDAPADATMVEVRVSANNATGVNYLLVDSVRFEHITPPLLETISVKTSGSDTALIANWQQIPFVVAPGYEVHQVDSSGLVVYYNATDIQVKRAGLYYIYACLKLKTEGTGAHVVMRTERINSGGSTIEFRWLDWQCTTTANWTIPSMLVGSCVLWLNANERLRWWVYSSSASVTYLKTHGEDFFTVMRIAPY